MRVRLHCQGAGVDDQAARDPALFVVDPDPGVRDAVRSLAGSVGLATHAFGTASEFLERYDPHRPGCLLLEVRRPGMGGLQLQETLAARDIKIPVVVMMAGADVSTVVRAFKLGAVDFLEKPVSNGQLLESVRRAIEVDTARHQREARAADVAARLARLSTRERAVLDGILAGKTNKVMALELQIRVRTVEFHRKNLMMKLEVATLIDLVRLLYSEPTHAAFIFFSKIKGPISRNCHLGSIS